MMLETTIADERILLLAERALYWPRKRTLMIADLHFGKAASFRSLGVPIPSGTTETDLERLSRLVEVHLPERLILLGDLIHARNGRATSTMNAVGQWRKTHRQLAITLVRGNHDLRAGDPPAEWNIHCTSEAIVEPPFVLQHEPAEDGRGYVLAGHVHPCVSLSDRTGSRLRASCFLLGRQVGILPAFGRFTGMHVVQPVAGDRVFAVGPKEVLEVSVQPV